jgi:hypothetical protein
MDFLTLHQHHLHPAAQLFANRDDALVTWPKNGSVAELGVAFGSFTAQIIERVGPSRFDAFDTFVLHTLPSMWGKPIGEWLQGHPTHRAYYESRFAQQVRNSTLRVFEGDSSSNLKLQQLNSYDVIYIDGDHSFEGAKKDADAALKALKPGGMLVFNDYVCYDSSGGEYGVMPVVQDLCINHGWRLRYLALQHKMFCDIALQKDP